MTEEIIPSYFCRRIHKYLHAEKMEDIAGRIIVHCEYYPNFSLPEKCQFDRYKEEKCLVKLAVRKEAALKIKV